MGADDAYVPVAPELLREIREGAERLEAATSRLPSPDDDGTHIGEVGLGPECTLRVTTVRRPWGSALLLRVWRRDGRFSGWYPAPSPVVVRAHQLATLARVVAKGIEYFEKEIREGRSV